MNDQFNRGPNQNPGGGVNAGQPAPPQAGSFGNPQEYGGSQAPGSYNQQSQPGGWQSPGQPQGQQRPVGYPYGYNNAGQFGPYNGPKPQQGPSAYNRNSQHGQQAYNQIPQQHGWQNPSVAPPSVETQKYQWNFDDYDRLDSGGKRRGKKNRGPIVFGVSVLIVISLSLVFVAFYGVLNFAMTDGTDVVQIPEVSQSSDTDSITEPEINRDDSVKLEIASRPEDTGTPSADGKLSIPQVAQAVLPSVVGVVKYERTDFFEPTGVGSGIIMTDTGYIVTNAHVIDGASDLSVILDNGETYSATLVGADRQTDLAVLKIEAGGLTPATFGDSTQVVVGETVLAIGNPAGMELAGSVTQGIVSAVNRVVRTSTYSMNYIQTDAAINPGNSGGALVNEYGHVIGINSSKIIATGFEGLGFAIPIADAQPIINDLIAHGRVTGRVVLSITAREVDEYDVRKYGVPLGLRVDSVNQSPVPGSRSLQKNDILTHIDGERVTTFDEVKAILKQHKEGDIVTLTVFRQTSATQNETFEVQMPLIEDQT